MKQRMYRLFTFGMALLVLAGTLLGCAEPAVQEPQEEEPLTPAIYAGFTTKGLSLTSALVALSSQVDTFDIDNVVLEMYIGDHDAIYSFLKDGPPFDVVIRDIEDTPRYLLLHSEEGIRNDKYIVENGEVIDEIMGRYRHIFHYHQTIKIPADIFSEQEGYFSIAIQSTAEDPEYPDLGKRFVYVAQFMNYKKIDSTKVSLSSGIRVDS